MKKLLLVITGLIFSMSGSSQSWTYSNASGGRNNADGTLGLEKDASGNIYLLADFEGTRTFGATTLTAVGFSDIYLTKFNSTGTRQWTIPISGTFPSILEATGVTCDAAGNVYVAGHFSYQVTFGGGTTVLTNPAGNNDGFIAKFNSSGAFIWGKSLHGNGNERITAIEASGTSIYICGSYTQAATLGALSLAAPATALDEAFLIKLDSAGTGIWGKKGGGSAEDRALAINISNNNVYWAGYFNATGTFGGTNVVAVNNSSDMFIVKLDEQGTQLWVKDYGGNWGEQINGVSQDPWGNAFCTGNFYGTVSFGTGMTIVEAYGMQPAGNGDAFIIKLNSADGTCQWVRQIKCINGDNNELSAAISTDPGGSAYITGSFSGTTVFSTNTSQTGSSLSATNGKDAFVAKYGQTGTLLWVQKIGAVNNDNGKAVVWDTNGDCIVAGNFGGSLTIGSLAAISAAGSGISSQYVARFDGLSTGLASFDSGIAFEVYPNPAHDFITVITSETMPISNYEIYGVNGALLLSDQLTHRTSEIKLNISELKTGMYFLHITSGEEKGIKKIQVN